MKRFVLYRQFDKDGSLLYVGISASFFERISSHKKHSWWFPLISRIELEHFYSLHDVRDAEERAIKSERPRYNVKHTIKIKPTEPPSPPGMAYPEEIAKILTIPVRTIMAEIKCGALPVVDPAAKRPLVREDDLNKYIEDRRNYRNPTPWRRVDRTPVQQT